VRGKVRSLLGRISGRRGVVGHEIFGVMEEVVVASV
jgi:hypothetical protein